MSNPSPSELQAKIARMAAHFAIPDKEEAKPHEIGADAVGAHEVTGRRGRYWLRSVAYSPRDPWGETWVEQMCGDAAHMGLRVPLNSLEAQFTLSKCLFVDCETTGLSGGTGTVAFLIAIGQFKGDEFIVDQYFLPDLSDEVAVLDHLYERLATASALVTYNGSSFDLPLLEGRFNFWRLDTEFRELPHLDLLWPTRSLFKHRMPSCALSAVEEQILKFARVEDLPGAEVPEVYFEYLRNGFSPRLHAVFEHNRLDVVSLFVYALWLNHRTHPESPALESADDLQCLARFWHRHRQFKPALRALEEAETRVNDRLQRGALHRLRASVLKRARDFESAHSEWGNAAAINPGDPSIAEELAKHLEHRRRDYHAALHVVDAALAALEFRTIIGESHADELRQRLLYRRERIARKLSLQ